MRKPPVFKMPRPETKTLVYTHNVERRKKTAERGYGGKWRAASKGHLKANPLCVHCKEKDIVRAAKCVDHIIPHKGNGALFWDPLNWQSLCYSCHSRKTVLEDGGFGNPIASNLERISTKENN